MSCLHQIYTLLRYYIVLCWCVLKCWVQRLYLNFPVVCVALVNSDTSFLHAGKGDASTPSGDAANGTSQNQDEPKSSDTMYIPSNLSYWRDVRASFVIPTLVWPNFLVFAISSVLESLTKDFDRHLQYSLFSDYVGMPLESKMKFHKSSGYHFSSVTFIC